MKKILMLVVGIILSALSFAFTILLGAFLIYLAWNYVLAVAIVGIKPVSLFQAWALSLVIGFYTSTD